MGGGCLSGGLKLPAVQDGRQAICGFKALPQVEGSLKSAVGGNLLYRPSRCHKRVFIMAQRTRVALKHRGLHVSAIVDRAFIAITYA